MSATPERKRREAVRIHLTSGEAVVWTGVPGGRLFLSRRQGSALVFNLVWWLIMLVVGASAWSFRDSPMMIVVGLILLIGVLQDSWRTGRWLARRIGEHYVLTNRRVLVIDGRGKIRAEAGLLGAHGFSAAPTAGHRGAILLAEDGPLFAPQKAGWLRLNPDEDAPRLSDLIGHLAVLDLIRRTAAAYEAQWAASADDEEGDQGLG